MHKTDNWRLSIYALHGAKLVFFPDSRKNNIKKDDRKKSCRLFSKH